MHAELSSTVAPAAWRPPWLIKASVVWHVGAATAAAAWPSQWPWALGAVALNHLLLTGVGLWPRSTWLGQNMRQLPPGAAARREIALTFDDGPDPEVTPAVLDILDAQATRATFFCIAERARRHPALCREIVRRGHSVQNHTQRHSHAFSLLGPRGLAVEIDRAQQTLAEISGELPRFFRAPAGLRSPLLAPVLQRLDLMLVSWTRRGYDTVQSQSGRVLSRLTAALAAGDILLLHDGHAARTANGKAVVLEVLPALLRAVDASGLRPVTLPQANNAQSKLVTSPAHA